MAVTREEIVTAAIALLDEAGLEGLTLRRLAQRLGIRAPTLYWHVRDKRELLDLMADAILGQALAGLRSPEPGQPWWDWLAELARRERAALLAHRDSALVLSGNTPVQHTFAAIEQEVRALVEAGFTPAQAVLTLRAVSAYVAGEVLDTQGQEQRVHRPDPPAAAPPPPDPADFPLLVAASREPSSPEQRFEYGLGLIISGLRARSLSRG